MILLKYTPILFILGSVIACSTPPEYPVEPYLEFIALSKDTLQEGYGNPGDDMTQVRLYFTDGDGDLSLSGQDTNNIILRDTRTDTIAEKFSIPDIPIVSTANGISGEIIFNLPTTCCIFPDPGLIPCVDEDFNYPYDTLVYEVHVFDKAGNESNRVLLDPIFIRCN